MSGLLAELRSAVLDPKDLDLLLRSECSYSRQEQGGWIEYQTAGESPEIYARAKFKRGVISELEIGPGLQRAGAIGRLREKAKESAEHTHGTLVANRALFAARPLQGSFRWRDVLRLSPGPVEAPNGSGFDFFARTRNGLDPDGPPYPLLLEVRVQRSPIALIESARIDRELERAQRSLTALVAGHVGPAHWLSGRQWVSLHVNDRIENHLVHPGFDIGVDGRQEDFLDFKGPTADLYAGEDYYDRLWGGDKTLTLPASLETDLTHVATLPPTDAAAFQRACYWFALGIQHRSEPSLAIVCFATSIECLLPEETSVRCPECNKPKVGPTQLFKQHLRKYAKVIPALEPMRDKLYQARSALVHGSFASRVDVDFFSSDEECTHSMLIEIVAQRGIVYWLRDRAMSSACTH